MTVISPRYTGVAKVLLENQESYFTRPDKASADPSANFDPEGVQSQAETVATTELARQAVDKLGLSERAEFNPAKTSNPFALALVVPQRRPRRCARDARSRRRRVSLPPDRVSRRQVARAADRIRQR